MKGDIHCFNVNKVTRIFSRFFFSGVKLYFLKKISQFFSLGRKRRDISEPYEERLALLRNIEKYFPLVMPVPPGSNSHQCVLRALCEVAKTPQNQDGLLGDFINLLLTPTYILDHLSKTQDSDYLEAQRKGHFLQDCSSYEHSCPLSLFEVI